MQGLVFISVILGWNYGIIYFLFFLHQSQDSVTSSTLKVKVQSGVHESKNTITQVITEIITN